MNLFKFFNKKNRNNFVINLIDTQEQFKDRCKIIVHKLIENFLEFHSMEKETFDKCFLRSKNEKLVKKYNYDKIINNFFDRKKEKLKSLCTEGLYHKISVTSLGDPTKYEFLINDCEISATMKSNKKIEISFKFNYAPKLEKTIKYEMRNINDHWLINKKQYKFKSDNDWNNDRTF